MSTVQREIENSALIYTLLLNPLTHYLSGFNSPILFALRTVCLMLWKLQYALYLVSIGALNVVHSPDKLFIHHPCTEVQLALRLLQIFNN